jgi:hypothetical protein
LATTSSVSDVRSATRTGVSCRCAACDAAASPRTSAGGATGAVGSAAETEFINGSAITTAEKTLAQRKVRLRDMADTPEGQRVPPRHHTTRTNYPEVFTPTTTAHSRQTVYLL